VISVICCKSVPDDRDEVVACMRGFQANTSEPGSDVELVVDRQLPAGQFWLWDNGEVVSMAAHSELIEGVVGVQGVYTPPMRRNRGYATA